ncbi:hypothetical protein Q1695_002505 [Nippostrongylus brasiliensis]|nr:hypothetical protein Q1695_002505 [Nippostrongylus brasiliensis]
MFLSTTWVDLGEVFADYNPNSPEGDYSSFSNEPCYRVRPDDPFCDKDRRHVSHVPDYENIRELNEYDTMSTCTSEMSVALSTESTLTLTEKDTTPTPVNGTLTRTPVLRRRRSTAQANLRRNYRIMAPDESMLILKQQSGIVEQHHTSPKSKILRRKSSRREKDIISPLPMVITPPVLLNRTQSCSLCCRERRFALSTFYFVNSADGSLFILQSIPSIVATLLYLSYSLLSE